MTLKRMDNVLIVVDDLEAVKAFFIELGLKLEGETTVEGPLVGRLIGLNDVEKRWVLKNPSHLFALDALFAAYPDALVIQCHRPAETIMASRHGNWEHATGVAMWLLWVTGGAEKPVYLGW